MKMRRRNPQEQLAADINRAALQRAGWTDEPHGGDDASASMRACLRRRGGRTGLAIDCNVKRSRSFSCETRRELFIASQGVEPRDVDGVGFYDNLYRITIDTPG